MQNIVHIESNDLKVSLQDIIDFSETEVDSILNLIKTHIVRFDRMGLVLPKDSRNRTDSKSVRFNEPQATFLITLMRNTEKVTDFKESLVMQFYAMREQLCEVNRKQLQSVQHQLEISQQQTIEAKTGKIYKDGLIALSTYIKNRELTISLYGAFEILKDKNIVETKKVDVWRKVLVDSDYGVQKEDTGVIEFDTEMLDEIFFGKVMTQQGLF